MRVAMTAELVSATLDVTDELGKTLSDVSQDIKGASRAVSREKFQHFVGITDHAAFVGEPVFRSNYAPESSNMIIIFNIHRESGANGIKNLDVTWFLVVRSWITSVFASSSPEPRQHHHSSQLELEPSPRRSLCHRLDQPLSQSEDPQLLLS